MRIAVIGSGVSGLVAAWSLHRRHDITVYEADKRIGGHSNTVDVSIGNRTWPVDTGFIVFNHKTYPLFTRLLAHLGVASHASDMSFSVRDDVHDLEYLGSDNRDTLFAQRRNIIRPRFWRMCADIIRFYKEANELLENGDDADPGETLGAWLRQRDYHPAFVTSHLIPMAAAIWSAPPQQMYAFPIRYLCRFLANHGMIQLGDRPKWRTVTGGSRSYVAALTAGFADRIHSGTPVTAVSREADGVRVLRADGSQAVFDEVILACHADQSLSVLADASRDEQRILSCFPYQPNTAVLHHDDRLLPRRRKAWGAWNYHRAAGPKAGEDATLTYNLSILQGHDAPDPLLVSLNPRGPIDPAKTVRRIRYHHPSYSRAAVRAQAQHHRISGVNGVHYCGAYWGYGFHEDGVRSGMRVAEALGGEEIPA
jgi:predicted NAD/FAD-binding protein